MARNRLFLVEQNAISLSGHYYSYTRCLAEAGRAAGLNVVILQNRALGADWRLEGVETIPAFDKRPTDSDAVVLLDWRAGNLAHDFVAATRSAPPAVGDRVLFSTLNPSELLQLMAFFTGRSAPRPGPIVHFLLRYDPGMLRASIDLFRPYCDRIRRSPFLRSRLLFHSDTESLAREYQRLTSLVFDTLPIAFEHTLLRAGLEKRTRSLHPDQLTVLYLGDARCEKNYTALPHAVAKLWPDYVRDGRIRFVIQSNFNTPGGEEGVLAAAQRLGQYPPDQVELLPDPLDPAAYFERLADADIVLVPYDPARYRFRSSGILIEALAAAKPVVTSAGSWMATQVDETHAITIESCADLGPAIAKLVDDHARFEAGARVVSAGTLERSAGQSFMSALLASEPTRDAIQIRRPLILFLADARDLAFKTAAGHLANSRLRYLSDVGYEVCLVLVAEPNTAVTEHDLERLRDEMDELGVAATFVGRQLPPDPGVTKAAGSGAGSLDEAVRQFAGLSVALDLGTRLRERRPDAIWLSRATYLGIVDALSLAEVPAICSVSDIEAFSIAVNQGRLIDAGDVATEFALLGRCRHIVSATPELSEHLRRSAPEAWVTTVAASYPAFSPAIVSLGGARDLTEVVVRARPLALTDSEERGPYETVLDRLAGWSNLDILLVLSGDPVDEAGARWFIEAVHLPHLAPLGFSLLVVGPFGQLQDLPQHDRVVLLGRVANPEPLYAAARVGVAPTLALSRFAAQLGVALANGLPVVATSPALRGYPAELGGVEVADEPIEMAAAISRLLASETARRDVVRKALLTAGRIFSPRREGDLLDGVLAAALGESALSRERSEAEVARDGLVIEWGPIIEAINGVVREWIAGRELDDRALRILAGVPQEELASLIGEAYGSSTACRTQLQGRGRRPLASDRAVRTGDHASHLTAGLLAAVAVSRGGLPPLSSVAEGMFEVAAASAYPLEIDVIGTPAQPLPGLAFDDPDVCPKPGAHIPQELRRYVRPAERNAFGERFGMGLRLEPGASPPPHIVLSQTVPIATSACTVLGRPLAEVDWSLRRDGACLVVQHEETVTLSLPSLLTTVASRGFVDLLSDGEGDLHIEMGGVEPSVAISLREGLKLHRAPIAMPASGLLPLRISSRSGQAALLEARCRVVIGPDCERALSLSDTVAPTRTGSEAARLALGVAAVEIGRAHPFGDLVQAVLSGRLPAGTGLSRLRRLVTREMASGRDPQSALRAVLADQDLGPDGWSAASLRASLAAILPAHSVSELGQGLAYVASPGLTAEISATFPDGGPAYDVRCLLNDVPISRDDNAHQVSWRAPGREHARGEPWLHRVTFLDGAGVPLLPVSAFVLFRLVAGVDVVTGGTFLDRVHFHDVEYRDGRPDYVWTGPRPVSLISLPVAPVLPGRMAVSFVNRGKNEGRDDIRLAINDAGLSPPVEQEDRSDRITATFSAEPHATAATRLRLAVTRMISGGSDPRILGAAIKAVELELQLR
jgi:glycosyltransferase involved in cell wall biosynthesis